MLSPDGLGWLEYCLVAQEEHLLHSTRNFVLLQHILQYPSHQDMLLERLPQGSWTPTSPDVVFQDVTCAP